MRIKMSTEKTPIQIWQKEQKLQEQRLNSLGQKKQMFMNS